jgi:hypothetical protein
MTATFSVNDLGPTSALQLTLWSGRPEIRTLTAQALTAFGDSNQTADLTALGDAFVAYLQFDSDEIATANYPSLVGFKVTHSELSEFNAVGRKRDKRSVRILTAAANGPILRGFGDVDHPQEITAVFSHLNSQQWERLATALGWNPRDLSTASAPGIAFYPTADPEMTLLSPPFWT